LHTYSERGKREVKDMKGMTATKKLIIGTVFSLMVILSVGSTSGATAQAQIWRGPRVVIVPRYRVFPYAWGFGYPYPVYGNPYYYGYGYTPRYDAGPYDVAKGKGYHDGFDRGQEDARDSKRFDPNNSSHFRNSISMGYRDGFRQGYTDGFNHRAG
jgi:hypothetical protein